MIPSLDAYLVNDLGLRSDVRRLPITELGCAGGAAALARARDFLRRVPGRARAGRRGRAAEPEHAARATCRSPTWSSTALFGDGAAAAVLAGGGRRAGDRPCASWRRCRTSSRDRRYALGFDLSDDGFHSVLSKDVPRAAAQRDRAAGRRAGRRGAGWRATSSAASCCTPAGARSSTSSRRSSGLSRGDTQPSWDVLRDYGNQSSASVLFVLHEWLQKRRPAPGVHGILAAFGPGLTTEMLLLRSTEGGARRMPTTTILFLLLVAAVGACRLIELRLSKRHQRALAERGAPVLAEPVFRAMVALHTGILVGAVIEVLRARPPGAGDRRDPGADRRGLANALRFWVIAALGIHWNVRVVPSMPLGVVTSGPYRFVRHPNYVAVFVELVALPLVHGAYLTAIAGAALHVVVLQRRIQLEEAALMADAGYRAAFAHKPRFVPWPMADRFVIAGGGPAGATLAMLLGRAGLASSCSRPRRSRARSRAARASCRRASPCWSARGCARPSAARRWPASATTASA